jgi:hypothetical protein
MRVSDILTFYYQLASLVSCNLPGLIENLPKLLLSGLMAWMISAHVLGFWYELNDWQQEILGMLSLWVKAFQSCGSITDQVIEFITKSKVDLWLFCWLVVISAPSPEILKPPCAWQGIYRSVYHG